VHRYVYIVYINIAMKMIHIKESKAIEEYDSPFFNTFETLSAVLWRVLELPRH